MTAAPIDNVLAQLSDARQMQSGQYAARCPAHGGKKRNLTIREFTSGAVGVYCFAGCLTADVVAAMGLEMSDLFPPRQLSGREPKRQPRLLTAGQALELLQAEATFIAVAAANLASGVVLTPAERERLRQAAARIGWLREESMGATS